MVDVNTTHQTKKVSIPMEQRVYGNDRNVCTTPKHGTGTETFSVNREVYRFDVVQKVLSKMSTDSYTGFSSDKSISESNRAFKSKFVLHFKQGEDREIPTFVFRWNHFFLRLRNRILYFRSFKVLPVLLPNTIEDSVEVSL